MQVALLVTCLVDGVMPQVGRATVGLLERLGVAVDVPPGQSCCGQMHINTGYPQLALPLVRRTTDVFGAYDAVVAPSGSCVATLRHQQARVARAAGDEGLAQAVERLAARTFELSEFVVDVLELEDVGAYYPHRVTYHPTCHSMRVLRVGERPVRLLRQVEGIELIELPHADQCCGFGGTFALKNHAVSAAMLADKLRTIDATGASVCTAGDASCLLHIDGGLTRSSAPARAVHLAEILASTR